MAPEIAALIRALDAKEKLARYHRKKLLAATQLALNAALRHFRVVLDDEGIKDYDFRCELQVTGLDRGINYLGYEASSTFSVRDGKVRDGT